MTSASYPEHILQVLKNGAIFSELTLAPTCTA